MFQVSGKRLKNWLFGTSRIGWVRCCLAAACKGGKMSSSNIHYAPTCISCCCGCWIYRASAGPILICSNKSALQIALWTSAHSRPFLDLLCVVLMGRIKARSIPSLKKCNFNWNVSYLGAQVLLLTEPALICVILLGVRSLFLNHSFLLVLCFLSSEAPLE